MNTVSENRCVSRKVVTKMPETGMQNVLAQTEVSAIQEKLLGILLYFQQFCESQGLGFVLAGGTCLGAVRHGGFIPWDDDLDVFMLREDYEKLPALWSSHADTARFACVRSDDRVNIHHTATEIKDSNTTFINRHSCDVDMHQGLMIDVIPIDGVEEGKLASLRQKICSMGFCCFNFQRLPEHKGGLTRTATAAALGLIRGFRARYRLWRFFEKHFVKSDLTGCRFVASFVEGTAIMRQHFPKEWFLDPGTLSFEGHPMPVPSDADAYLRISYGDYMQLPPPEERICRHDCVFIDLENSYTKYKGIHYCVNG